MAIHHWHPLKIILLWASYFLVMLITWAASFRVGLDQAIPWFILFIPVFAITWRWATGLQKASNFTQGEGQPSAKVGTLRSQSHFSFSAIGWKKIALVLVVATSGAAGGYWYKDFESHNIPTFVPVNLWEAPAQTTSTPQNAQNAAQAHDADAGWEDVPLADYERAFGKTKGQAMYKANVAKDKPTHP